MRFNQSLKAVVALLLIVLIFWFFNYWDSKKLDDNYRITIAWVTKLAWPSDGQESAKIYYRYNNKVYYGSFSILLGFEGKFKIGSRVFVKFSPQDPDFAVVEHEYFVPDTLQVPANGWKEMPVKIRL